MTTSDYVSEIIWNFCELSICSGVLLFTDSTLKTFLSLMHSFSLFDVFLAIYNKKGKSPHGVCSTLGSEEID